MKKEYIIGGVLGILLCGTVAYAVITYIEMRNNERAQLLAELSQPPVPLEVALPETRQPAQDNLSDQGKATPAPALSGSRRTDELKADALTGVRITLKNGRSVIAESCRDLRGRLLCMVAGGSMQIDRKDIASIRDVKLRSISDQTEESSDDADAGEQKKDGEKTAEKTKIEGGNGPAKTVGGLTAEQTRKYDELDKRRAEIAADREKLIKDREELHAEVNSAGIIRSKEKLDAIQAKINALDQRIKSFNEIVNKLNEDIAALSASGQKKQ